MSAAPPSSADALRRLLAEKFPSSQPRPTRVLATGLPALDAVTGGLPLGAITEIVCSAPSCGGHLVFARLLEVTRATRGRVALIDASDSFDPASYSKNALDHLLWVRGRSVNEALQVADLLVRDANLALILLDLRDADQGALRRLPATVWYRLQRAVEPSGLALVVESSRPTVPSALLRVELQHSHGLSALSCEQSALASQLEPAVQRHRLQLSESAGQ